MINNKTAIEATETSLNSYGSAMREQEKYNESLEARINRLNTAWYGFADSLGNTVLYDGIVVGTEALSKMTNVAEGGASSTALLSLSMGALIAPLTLISSRFTGFTSNLIMNTAQQVANARAVGTTTVQLLAQQVAMVRTSIATKGLSGSLLALATSSTAAGVAIRSALMMTGVGVAIAGVTALITVLTSKISENIQKQEEFDTYINKNKEALTTNREQVDKLISTYNHMSKANQSAWNTEEQEKYISVQNQLAELFPSIIDYVDSNGNAHIKSKEAIQQEIIATNELIEAERTLQREQAKKTFDDGLKEVNKLNSRRKAFTDTRDNKFNNHTSEELAKLNLEILKVEKQISDKSDEIKGSVLSIADAFTEAGTTIESVVKDHINKSISNIDFTKLNSQELESFSKSLAEIRTSLNDAFKSGDTDAVSKYNTDLLNLINSTNSLKPEAENLKVDIDKLTSTMEDNAKASGDMATGLDDVEGSTSALDEKINDLIENMTDFKTVQEQLVGVSEASVKDSEELLFMYRQLSNQLSDYTDKEIENLLQKKNLSTEESRIIDLHRQRIDTISMLNVLYPQYAKLQEGQISLSKQQIEAMQLEEKANKVLLESYKLASEGKYTAEQEMTLAQAMATKARIENIKKEIEALNILNQELQKYINNSSTMTDDEAKGSMRASMLQANNLSAIDTRASELSSLQSELSTSIDGLGKINTKINESSSKSSKKTAKATKESIYLTDKFKQSLEAVNLAIEKQQNLQSQHPKHSETYRKSLQAQLKLEREKLKLIQDQATALDKQIKSGKIAQTGNVTIGDGNSKSTTTSTKKLSGWDGRITSKYGAYDSVRNGRMHTGVDIAGAKGTRLDSNVSGKVISTGKNSLSGNYIQILDDKGMKHFYGHLDKIVAKLGDVVKVGDQIGNIGNTGNSTGSHLHYQMTNSSGNTINPIDYVNAAKQMTVSAQTVSTVVSNTTQSIDDAKSTLIGLQGDALQQMQKIAELEKAIIDSQLSAYDHKRGTYDATISFEQAKLKNVTVGTTQYNKTMEKQSTLLKAKQRVNNEELAYIEGLIKSGNLSAITLDEMKARTLELKTSMQALNAELGNLALDKIMDAHSAYTQKQDNVLDYEKNKLEELDKNSTRYVATLEKMNTHMNRKILTHQQTIKDIENEIKVLGLQGEALKRAKDEIQKLTLEMQNFKQEMVDNNYEIIVNIKTRYDEEIDDLNFEIERSKAIQAMYKEGSADYANEIKKQIEWQQKLVDAHDKSRKALQEELKIRDLTPERIKEVTELMEDETIAYWNAKRAVEELNESLEETRKKLLNDIADKFISALKNVYEEQRDMHLDALDDQMEAEEKAHQKRIEQLNKEMDLFRKNIEEKLRLLDRQDAERSYNMEIDELESERNKVVDQINLLSLDDSHEAKTKRKKLLEQLDKIDKDIAEKRYQRDLELQKQGLNDLLEDKEEELDKVEENYDKQNQATLDSLREQRKYWEQYYNDLLNDERKFAQIREDILNGHFDKVVNEFEGHLQEMIATMPQLENTLNGTMQAVGTAIRKNVIDEINNAIKALREFQDMQNATGSITDNFNPNDSKDESYGGNTGNKPPTSPPPSNNGNNSNDKGQVYQSLNRGDMQVLFGKFISDVVAPTFKAESKERLALKSEGLRLGKLGRGNSSQIPVASHFSNEIGNLTSSQVEQLKSFIKGNSNSILGGNYASTFNKHLASLDTGGMTKYRGLGNDGKGGKLATLHPNEIVLNPLESEEMLKTSSILSNIMSKIPSVLAKLPTLTSNSSNVVPNVEINLNGEIHNSNNRTAKDLVSEMANEMRTRGLWT